MDQFRDSASVAVPFVNKPHAFFLDTQVFSRFVSGQALSSFMMNYSTIHGRAFRFETTLWLVRNFPGEQAGPLLDVNVEVRSFLDQKRFLS
jgi:hypothetical protein